MVHGDAGGPADGHQSGHHVSGASVWDIRCAHCVYPPGYGGTVCLPPCSQAALVGYLLNLQN